MTPTPPCPCSGHTGPREPGTVAGWHRRKGPWPALATRHGTATPLQIPATWIDHFYRLRENGNWVYVAEPYDLGDDALRDIAFLQDQGFKVSVSASRARHYPGMTIAVEIRPTSARG